MRRTHLLSSVLILAFAGTAAVEAATCRVTPTGTGNGSSWSSPMALQAALAASNCGEIWIRAGLYKPVQPANPSNPTQAERRISFVIRPGLRVYGGFAGNETRRDQRDPAQHLSVLSGDIDNDDTTDANGIVTDPQGVRFSNSYHVLLMDGGTAAGPINRDTVLDGVVITAGRGNGSSSDRFNVGGGLFCRATNSGHRCSPTLRDIVFSGNVAGYGAALYNLGITGGVSQPLLHRVHFTANHATSYGGGMGNDGSNAGDASPVLRDVRFTGNRAGSYGGAIYSDASAGGKASALIDQVQFSGNNATYGGAIYNDSTGGGQARPVITNATFQGNTASNDGGAIYNHASSSGDGRATLRHVTFSGNTAARGGAIANIGGSNNPTGANPTLSNVILWGNQASQQGAEIHNQNAQPVLRHSIVAGGCPAGAQCIGVLAGNPLLGALADNGGWSWTMKPGNGSPAINAAADADCPVIDQRGVPRAQGLRCDIGAFEVEAAPCYVRANAGGSNNGSSWTNAYTSLQTALANSSCGEIRVARGVYTPTSGSDINISFNVRPGQRLYGGFAGNETTLQQRDPAANPTVLSGDIGGDDSTDAHGIVISTADIVGSNSHRVVLMDGSTGAGPILATTVLDGFAITAGRSFDFDGGGLYCRGSGAGNECSPTLTNLLFSANMGVQGGGIFNAGGNGGRANPTVSNTTFRNNVGIYGGGGMYNQGWQSGESSPLLSNVTFIGNTFNALVNDGGYGGVSSPWLNHVTFSDNSSRFGGSSVMNTSYNGTSEPVFSNVIAWGGFMTIPDEPECDMEICNLHNTLATFTASLIAGGCPTGGLCGPDVSGADPLLAPLSYSGGATPTLVPQPSSPAIDAGDADTCAELDQRGVSRPQGGGCDIGAVEYQPGGEDRIFDNGFQMP